MPKIGIRPAIDGRRKGIRESLEVQTMNMAKAAAALITKNLRHPNGEKVECDSRVAGIACTGTLNLRSTLSDMLSELSGIFSIKSRRQDGVWYVTLSSE